MNEDLKNEIDNRIKDLYVECPECESYINSDDQYQCSTCGGSSRVYAVDYMSNSKDMFKCNTQINHYLTEFTNLSNEFLDNGLKTELSEYYKGQVMGIVKVITLFNLDINYKYYLDQLS